MLRIDDLQYKGLRLYQDTNGFCFGTDAVLLAAFARIRKGERIADICAGNGIIALLTTARCAPSYCLAAELQPEAAQLCRKNVEFNSMTDIIEVCQADVRLLGGNGLAGSFDAVTCNPPYSRTTAPATDSLQKRMARQELTCTLEDAVGCAARLLRFGGRLALVHQAERTAEVFEVMRRCKLEPKRARLVQPSANKPPKLLLVEGVRGGKPGMLWEPVLVLTNPDGSYTPQAKELYHITETGEESK